MIGKIFHIYIVSLLFFNSTAQSQQDSSLVLTSLKRHIYILADDSLKGRRSGSPEEKIVNRYILSEMKQAGKGKPYTWNYKYQYDSLEIKSEMAGWFVNNHADTTLIIAAHSDHIGMGGKLSKSFGIYAVHNGADDNASGVALLLELQKKLSTEKIHFNLLFVTFTGHEEGTFGSNWLAEHLNKKWDSYWYMINFDMVGRMNSVDKTLYIAASEKMIDQFKSDSVIQIQKTDNYRVMALDTKHFMEMNIPCATFTTGMHNDYHKTSDDAQFIHYNELYLIYTYLLKTITNPAFLK